MTAMGKVAIIDGLIRDVISHATFLQNYYTYCNPELRESFAVEISDISGHCYVLPVRNKNESKPGIYIHGTFYHVNLENAQEYAVENCHFVDFSNTGSITEYLQKNKQIRDLENTELLTDARADSIFIPNLTEADSPEMRAFKEAVILKKINAEKYAPLFGSNYANDWRLFKSNSITLKKLVHMCRILGIKVTLTLEDETPDTPNPMGVIIKRTLTSDEGD